MPRVRIAWKGGEVTANLRETPSVDECRLVTRCNVLGKIEGDPRRLAKVKPGISIRVELLDEN